MPYRINLRRETGLSDKWIRRNRLALCREVQHLTDGRIVLLTVIRRRRGCAIADDHEQVAVAVNRNTSALIGPKTLVAQCRHRTENNLRAVDPRQVVAEGRAGEDNVALRCARVLTVGEKDPTVLGEILVKREV